MLDFLAVLFIVLGGKFSGNLAVEGGKVGFELLQFAFLPPDFSDDAFKRRNIGFEFGGTFLMLGN